VPTIPVIRINSPAMRSPRTAIRALFRRCFDQRSMSKRTLSVRGRADRCHSRGRGVAPLLPFPALRAAARALTGRDGKAGSLKVNPMIFHSVVPLHEIIWRKRHPCGAVIFSDLGWLEAYLR
jgi:hypothetical protein